MSGPEPNSEYSVKTTIAKKEIEINAMTPALAVADESPTRYLQQLNLLTMTRHLSMLLMEAQKHRGTSMAVLEGDSAFEPQVLHEHSIIQRLIDVLSHLNKNHCRANLQKKWQDIEKDWQSLIHNWRNDTVIANFEFHSHIIESMVKLIWELAGEADYFSLVYEQSAVAAGGDLKSALFYSEKNHELLIQISLKLIPEMLENIAKLRGLATHASVRGYCDGVTQSHFSYLLQSLNLNKEKLRLVSRSLQHDALRAVPSLPSILLHEHKLDQLQLMIQNKIMNNEEISVKGLYIFNFATEIIDVYSQIIRDAITAFQRRLEYALLK